MDDQELRELENPETWADDEGEVRAAVKSPRAVVSVSFSRDNLRQVEQAARQQGMKTSEFIREAAVNHAARRVDQSVVLSVSGTVRIGHPPVMGGGSRARFIQSDVDTPVTT